MSLSPGADMVIRGLTSGSTRIRLVVVLVLAFALRLAAILAIDDPQKVPRNINESAAPTYYVLAEHVLDGTGYRYSTDRPPTAMRTPGYPIFIAGVFKAFGRNFNAVRMVQGLLDVITTYMVFALAYVLFGTSSIALLAAVGYALYFPAIQDVTYILPETTYTFFLALAVLLAIVGARLRSYIIFVASGISFAVSSLIKPGAIALPLVLLVVSILAAFGRRGAIDRGVGRVIGEPYRRGFDGIPFREFAILCLAFAVTTLPWVVRNERALGKPILTSTLVGSSLYKGNHLATRGTYLLPADSLFTPDLRARLSGASEVERNRILAAEARRTALSHPGAVALMTLRKIPRLWLNLGYGRSPSARSLVLAIAHILLLGLAAYALLLLPSDARSLTFIPLTTVIFSTIMYLTVASVVRLVFPLVPLVLPYSGLGLVDLAGRLRTRRERGVDELRANALR